MQPMLVILEEAIKLSCTDFFVNIERIAFPFDRRVLHSILRLLLLTQDALKVSSVRYRGVEGGRGLGVENLLLLR